jgi:hypothetical protein
MTQMKSIPALLVIVLLAACNQGTKTETEKEKAETSVNFKSTASPSPYAGNWVSEPYLKSILSDQSPRKAQEGSEEVFIRLPGTTQKTATMIYNFHEAVGDLVLVNHDGTFELWEKQNDTLHKSVYTITRIADDTIRIGEKRFVKIQADDAGDQSRILEAVLFSGQYTDKKGGMVEFKTNGEVTGLADFKYYQPVLDYFDAGLQVDQVGLGQTQDKMEYFGFKFQKEKLDIYKLKCKQADPVDNRCLDVAFGDKLFELKRTGFK